MNSKAKTNRAAKMYAKRAFMNYCIENGWQFHLTSLHETYVNSNKLTDWEKFCPSFIVDRDFNNMSIPVTWVEVKSCNRDGDIRVSKYEFGLHQEFNEGREVQYALYDSRSRVFRLLTLDKIAQYLTEDGDYLKMNFDAIGA